jgi:hypothetical protein
MPNPPSLETGALPPAFRGPEVTVATPQLNVAAETSPVSIADTMVARGDTSSALDTVANLSDGSEAFSPDSSAIEMDPQVQTPEQTEATVSDTPLEAPGVGHQEAQIAQDPMTEAATAGTQPAVEANGTGSPNGTIDGSSSAADGQSLAGTPENSAAGQPATAPETQTTDGSAPQGPEQGAQSADGQTATPESQPNASNQENSNANQPETNNATAPETNSVEQQRTELAGRVRDGTATAEDRQRLNEINEQQNAAARRTELTDRLANGETLSTDEMAELNGLSGEAQAAGEAQLSDTERLNKEVEDMGTDLMQKMANGEIPSEAELDAFRAKQLEMQTLKSGFSPEQARAAVQAALNPEYRGSLDKRMALEQEMQEKLQHLMTLEFQLLAMPKRLDALKKERNRIKRSIRNLPPPSSKDTGLDIKARQDNRQKLGQVANLRSQIIMTKNTEMIVQADYADTMQYVRRKLGVSSGLQAVMEFAGAKLQVAGANMSLDVQSYLDNE